MKVSKAPRRTTKSFVLSSVTAEKIEQVASSTGRSASAIVEELLGAGLSRMILEALPAGSVATRLALGSIEGRLTLGNRPVAPSLSFELLAESSGDLLTLVHAQDDRGGWTRPDPKTCAQLVAALNRGEALLLSTPAGLEWRIEGLIDTTDRRVDPPAPRLIARLRRHATLGSFAGLRGVLPGNAISDEDLRRARAGPRDLS